MEKLTRKLKEVFKRGNKYDKEADYWTELIPDLILWYEGKVPQRRETLSPSNDQKIKCYKVEHSAILTWFELHQKPKYVADLQLSLDVFRGMKVLDVGSGPIPSAEVFEDCSLYCLDPLFPNYLSAGYPLHYYGGRTRFVCGYSEDMPFIDDFFDAVISVNAIDHVDDIYLAAKEIERVLKPGGMIRMHVHYHKRKMTEPLELNDEVMQKAFGWCIGFQKISEKDKKMGASADPGESYTIWSNF